MNNLVSMSHIGSQVLSIVNDFPWGQVTVACSQAQGSDPTYCRWTSQTHFFWHAGFGGKVDAGIDSVF